VDIQIYDIAIVPLIVGIIAVATGIGMPKKFAPILAVLFGVLIGLFYVAPDDPAQGVLVGVALGLAAVGLHSGAKNTLENKKDEG